MRTKYGNIDQENNTADPETNKLKLLDGFVVRHVRSLSIRLIMWLFNSKFYSVIVDLR